MLLACFLLTLTFVHLFQANAWAKTLIYAQVDKNSKLEVAYKNELRGMIKFEWDSQEKEAFVDVERSWTTERETLKVRLGEAERLLAFERSLWDADRSIFQSNLDGTREEIS